MKLCIDPGHGLSSRTSGVYDPGACSGPHQEADIALTWSLTLRDACEALSVPVWMTRQHRQDAAPLSKRVAAAKASGCTHLISVHCNASDNPKANGIETLYEGTPRAAFAESLQRVLIGKMGLTNRGIKWASIDLKRTLAVLRFDGPAALIELGFLTNAVDRAKLLDAEVRLQTCAALAVRLALYATA